MSKRVLILVEGQTEERFVKDVLAPEFWNQALYLEATILMTKRVKDGPNFKGGVTNYAKFRNDAMRLLNCSGGALVTTLLDYYGLPSDFPGMNTLQQYGTAVRRVDHLERSIADELGNPTNFLPFLALHEFEAWLFSSATELPRALTDVQKQNEFEAVRNSFATPEEINERPEYSPSKRITNLFPAYKKRLHGPTVAQRIGLAQIRKECPHFNSWISKLEAFASA
jgi:Domain of unknown function (DUF4276)